MRPEVFADTSLRSILCLAGRRVDVGALRVLGDGESQRLTPKAVGVLLELAREPGVTRTREELLARVWAGRAGDGDVLTQAVKELRRVFGDDLSAPRFIETVPRLGYRLHPHVAAEGEFEWLSEADVEIGGSNAGTIEAWTFMAGVKAYVLPDRVQPYLGLALGGMVAEAESGPLDNTESSFALRVGGGVDVYITRNIYGNFGISYVIPTDDMLDELDYVSFGWGFGYRF